MTIKDKNKNEKNSNKVGEAIVYNGDKVIHKVSKQAKDGKRITLINLTTNPNFSLIEFYKNTQLYVYSLYMVVYLIFD